MTTSTVTTPLHATARELVGTGRGILAADESISTMSKRLEGAGVAPTGTNRRDYRELLVTTPGLADGASGVILCDETLRQSLTDGRPFPVACAELGILPGIKVDTGAKPLAGAPDETVTEGLDGLDDRLAEYAEMGARFAKWRAVLTISGTTPTRWAQAANAHALARYARSCQEAGLVPVVEPEVLMDGAHSLSECASITESTLLSVTRALTAAGVDPAGMVLKPNMVLPGAECPQQSSPAQVARATVEVLRCAVSPRLAGVAFLSGGQSPETATANLAALQELDVSWPLTFSFGRALVSPALEAWGGDPDRVADGQAALAHHVDANAAVLRDDRSSERTG
jgi:fructose-bisphosphate aldolase class I